MDFISGRYSLETRIQETTSADVFRARRNADGAPVVIKLMRSEYPSAAELARFEGEYAILRSIQSPQVVRALALEKAGNRLALVLEDAGDVTLAQVVREGPGELRHRLEISLSLVRALQSLHRERIIHRDIKPQHFVQDRHDATVFRLVDLGLAARLADHVDELPQAGELAGSLSYIAPEQTGRMARGVDRRSDLYSLGIVLFELFAGRLPFESTEPLELIHSHIARMPPPLESFNSEVPAVLSGIVSKLLAKVAEDRYQNAGALEHDLIQCLNATRRGETLRPFPLGERGQSGTLCAPKRLYGRDAAIAELLLGYERAKGGRTETVYVSGPSGIGKTAIVAEARRRIRRGGYFAVGPCDPLTRSVPFAPVARVCRDLVQTLLAEPPEILAARKAELTSALGTNGQVLLDAVPDLEAVIGPQPTVISATPGEAQHRFEVACQAFLGVFALAPLPLVLFFDDLQWADSGSVRLIERLMTSRPNGHMLVIGAYRSHDLEPGDPLSRSLEALKAGGAPLTEIDLKPLELADLENVLGDVLCLRPEETGPLAGALLPKTHGNPFFVHQFLSTLVKTSALSFDETAGTWSFDTEKVNAAVATDNVVELMVARLGEQRTASRDLLPVAAAIGRTFDGALLASIVSRSPDEVARDLEEAVGEGLLLRASKSAADGKAGANAAYRFSHDRVQRAAYQLLDPALAERAHLAAGRALLADKQYDRNPEVLFEIVAHMNRGVGLIAGDDERRTLAQLNLTAARRLRDAGASAEAGDRAGMALTLLGADAFTRDYSTAYRAALLRAECEYMNGRPEEALAQIERVASQAQSVVDRVKARNLGTVVLISMGRLREACSNGVESARMLGAALPDPSDEKALGAAARDAQAAFETALAGRTVESLLDLPMMRDAEPLTLVEAISATVPAAYQSNQALMPVIILHALQLFLRHGTSPLSANLYSEYGTICVAMGNTEMAYQFGDLGIRLTKKIWTPATTGHVHFLFGGFICHWSKPISRSLEYLRDSLRMCLDVADPFHAAYCASFDIIYRIYAGDALDNIEASIPAVMSSLDQIGDVVNKAFVTICRQNVLALRGKTRTAGTMDSDDFSERVFDESPVPPFRALHGIAKCLVRYFAGRYDEVLAECDAFQPLPALFYNVLYPFYRALALVQVARTREGDERQTLIERAKADAEVLATYARLAPSNNAHRHALVLAELATLEGDGNAEKAMALYDRAIEEAQTNGFLHEQALANELCAAYHLGRGRPRVARPYLTEAHYCYGRWGATPKVEALEARHPELRAEFGGQVLRGSQSRWRDTVSSQGTTFDGNIDLTSAVRATEAIASELVLEKVLERLAHTLIENACAQRGFLVLDGAEGLRIQVALTLDPDCVRIGSSERIQDSVELPPSIVQYVARTGQTVMLNDPARGTRFSDDPYVARSKPKSVLCIPMLHRGRAAGALYLENNLATDAFSPARTAFLQFLAAQAAAAVENARLYSELEAAGERLRHANEHLEGQVAERTEKLRRVVADLWSEIDLARKIQTVLLPDKSRVTHYDIAATMVAAESVGGDYYDIIEGGETDWVLIGDVSGHGVPAGLTMMMVQTAARTIALANDKQELSPARMLARVNTALRDNFKRVSEGQYMTITALELGPGKMRHSGLHQDILVYRAATGAIDRVTTHGIWLGLEEEIGPLLDDQTIPMQDGDTALLFTDGITEFRVNGEMVGVDGIVSAFQAIAARSTDPARVVEHVLGILGGKAAPDDVTLVALRYRPQPGNG